jgi:hypothetical protein
VTGERDFVRRVHVDPRQRERGEAEHATDHQRTAAVAEMSPREQSIVWIDRRFAERVFVVGVDGLARRRELGERRQRDATQGAFLRLVLREHLAAKRAGFQRRRHEGQSVVHRWSDIRGDRLVPAWTERDRVTVVSAPPFEPPPQGPGRRKERARRRRSAT